MGVSTITKMGFLLSLAFLVGAQDRISAVSPSIDLVSIKGHGAVKDFKIGRFEVTMKQFEAFVRDAGYDGRAHPSSKSSEPFLLGWSAGKPPVGKDRYPVCYVNWHHAKAFCVWLSMKSGLNVHLPTDAQWTLAASGVQGRTYPWGNAWDPKRCNWGDEGKVDGYMESAPVGSFPRGATPEGVLDMAGNIWEWSAEGHLRGGPWCMDKSTVLCTFVAHENTERCDDKFGLRIAVGG
ncbi:MAG: SUMF1/EgtB/PvdO family nonheme iron enzyme [Armatimonadetes bacterium]|nr:SUMF1/EgtB/PvdO family nonheme iron enzyme [Armatimonadota bacterium]